MNTNDGTEGTSPRELWLESKGDLNRFRELMIQHGHIEKLEKVEPNGDPLIVQAIAEANAPLCSKCRRLVSLTDKGIVKVHFATNDETRPCSGSYKAWNG